MHSERPFIVMPQHVFLAFTNPAGEREEPFNSWYDGHHVPEVLRYGRGFNGCRRYRLEAGARAGGFTPWRYLALYDVESDDLALLASQPFVDGAQLTPFRGLVEEDHVGWVYTPATPRVLANPSYRPPSSYADCLVLAWRDTSAELLQTATLRDSLARAPGYLAARAYSKGTAQRSQQQDSPWQGLVIYETERAGHGAQSLVEEVWTYVAVADYVGRTPA
jgi:hypothetical protein